MKNLKYSHKDFTGIDLSGEPTEDFAGEIIGSCFAQESLDSNTLPAISGVTFTNCNLDNVSFPVGNTITGGCNRRISPQNDLEDWLVDGANKPTEPVSKKIFLQLGISINPADIPAQALAESRLHSAKVAAMEVAE